MNILAIAAILMSVDQNIQISAFIVEYLSYLAYLSDLIMYVEVNGCIPPYVSTATFTLNSLSNNRFS